MRRTAVIAASVAVACVLIVTLVTTSPGADKGPPEAIVVSAATRGWSRADVTGAGAEAFVALRGSVAGRIDVRRIDAKGRVHRLPLIAGKTSDGTMAPIVMWQGAPCVGATQASVSSIWCHREGRWTRNAFPPDLRGWGFGQLQVSGSDLHVLVVNQAQPNLVAVLRLSPAGAWTLLPAPPEYGSGRLVVMGAELGSPRPQILLGVVGRGKRAVFGLEGDHWERLVTDSPSPGLVNQASGPCG